MGESLGDEEQDALIIEYMPLALKIARQRGNKDCFISAALFGLVKSVRWLNERCKHDNKVAYIAATIRSHVYEAINECYTIDRPRKEINTSLVQVSDEAMIYRKTHQDHGNMILDELLNKFPPVEQRLIRLRIDGWSLEEIAEEFGTNVSDIHRRIKMIRKRIR